MPSAIYQGIISRVESDEMFPKMRECPDPTGTCRPEIKILAPKRGFLILLMTHGLRLPPSVIMYVLLRLYPSAPGAAASGDAFSHCTVAPVRSLRKNTTRDEDGPKDHKAYYHL